MTKKVPRCRLLPASRRVWSLYNESFGVRSYCNQSYGYGHRWGLSTACYPRPRTSLSFKANTPTHRFSSQGLPGRCARNTERSAVKNQRVRREERGSGVCSFLPRSRFRGCRISRAADSFCHRHIADRRGRGYTAFLSGCTRSGEACGQGRRDESPAAPLLQSSSNSRMPERHSGDAGANPADCTNFQDTCEGLPPS